MAVTTNEHARSVCTNSWDNAICRHIRVQMESREVFAPQPAAGESRARVDGAHAAPVEMSCVRCEPTRLVVERAGESLHTLTLERNVVIEEKDIRRGGGFRSTVIEKP